MYAHMYVLYVDKLGFTKTKNYSPHHHGEQKSDEYVGIHSHRNVILY